MTDFHFPKRFDDTLAKDGVWFEVVDENDNEWGSFLCSSVDRTLPRYKIALEALQRKYKGRKKPGEDFSAELFVQLSLNDWKLKDAKGKSIPYTREDAIKYFSQPEAAFVLNYLSALVEDVKNFQSEEQEDAGDPTGN